MSIVRPLVGSTVLALGLTAAAAAPALAAKPTDQEKAAVIKAWSTADGGEEYTGPQKCIKVRLANSNKNVAALKYVGEKRHGCGKHAFDGSAILYGHKKKHWYLLVEGSDIPNSQCKALPKLMGTEPWNDLAGFGKGLGCENFD